jgi:hypothetical protein
MRRRGHTGWRGRDGLADWARAHNWVLTPGPAVDWGARLPGGNRGGVAFAVSTTIGGRVVSAAEYAYTETHIGSAPDGAGGSTSTTSSHTHEFVVTVVRLRRTYPPMSVEPRGRLARLGRRVFGAGGAVTGNPAFDRGFRVQTPDPAAARQLITPALVAAHLAGTVPAWSVYGAELLAYHPGRIKDPEHIPALVAPLLRVATLLD